MSEYDLHSNIDDRVALDNQDIASDTTTPGAIIDTSGFESIEFIIQSGTITDGSYAILLEESDNASMPVGVETTVVSADQTLGALTGFVAANDDETIRVGSIGKDRYQRLSLVSTGTTTGGEFSAIAVLGHPHTSPVAQ